MTQNSDVRGGPVGWVGTGEADRERDEDDKGQHGALPFRTGQSDDEGVAAT